MQGIGTQTFSRKMEINLCFTRRRETPGYISGPHSGLGSNEAVCHVTESNWERGSYPEICKLHFCLLSSC